MRAPGHEQKYKKYKDQGFVIVGIMADDSPPDPLETGEGTVESLVRWKEELGITHVLMTGKAKEVFMLYWDEAQNGFPSHKLMEPGMKIVKAGPYYVPSAPADKTFDLSDELIEEILP